MRQFKYTSTFASLIKCVPGEDKGKKLALAAVDNLKSIIPADVLNNPALLPIAYNACVINRANKNDDVIGTDTGLAIYKLFNHGQINAEHNRDNIVGHIVNSALSSFDENYAMGAGSDLLPELSLVGTVEPFNISLAGVIYRVLGTALEDAIETATDPNSPNFLGISASWEIGFDEFDIAIGPRDLKECRIVSSDNGDEFMAYSRYLKAFGGSGKTDSGDYVWRLIKGDVLPLGIGLTFSPAADVAGIVVAEKPEEDIPNEDDEDEIDASASEVVLASDLSKIEKINVTLGETPILNPSMKFKSFNEAIASLTDDAAVATFTREELKELLSVEILKANDTYKAELQTAKDEAQTLAESKQTLEGQKTSLQSQFDALQGELQVIKDNQAAAEAAQKFDERMTSLDEKFELSDKQREIIAKSIRGLSDEDFATYLENQAAFLVEKKAEPIAPIVEVVEVPATAEAIASVVAAVVPTPETVPNSVTTEESYLEKLRKSFSETELITVK